jgi:hypothetical protein
MAKSDDVADEVSTVELVREALDEARELAKLEVALARADLLEDLKRAKTAAIGLAIALAAGVGVLCLLATALVFALGGTAAAALGVAGVLVVVAGLSGYAGYALLPKTPLERTRLRLGTDVTQLWEHTA